jgi:hypothetical protein
MVNLESHYYSYVTFETCAWKLSSTVESQMEPLHAMEEFI